MRPFMLLGLIRRVTSLDFFRIKVATLQPYIGSARYRSRSRPLAATALRITSVAASCYYRIEQIFTTYSINLHNT